METHSGGRPLEMVSFALLMAAFVAAHGATDVLALSSRMLSIYAVAIVVCVVLPRVLRWIVFLLAAVLHFAEDSVQLGLPIECGAGLVAVALVLYFVGWSGLARKLIYAVMIFVHMPMHYAREVGRHGASAVGAVVAVATFLFVLAFRPSRGEQLWDSILRRYESLLLGAVVGHVLVTGDAGGG